MTDIIYGLEDHILTITLNRIEKHNAFDDELIKDLHKILDDAIANPEALVIVLNANGSHFSAGADIHWMQRMVHLDEVTNLEDALGLGRLLYSLYHCPKPTIAVVQGLAYGGAIGLIAACDIAIAGQSARFCFSEVKLGLIPALISPYIIKAMGERLTKWLFMTAHPFTANDALRYHLVHMCMEDNELQRTAHNYAKGLATNGPQAVLECKALVNQVSPQPIDDALVKETARLIAKKRVSKEGQLGLNAFLNKEKPLWN